MTILEIQKALRHGAQVCIECDTIGWAALDVIPQDDAVYSAADFLTTNEVFAVGDNAAHAATFLLLVAEALA